MLKYQEKSINTKPLLDEEDTDSDIDNEIVISTNDSNDRNIDYVFKTGQPADNYYLAYIIFYLFGITSLLPWNFFITADNYWMYKFRDPHAKQIHPNVALNLTQRTPLQAEFITYLNVASNIPSIAFLILNAFLTKKIALQYRIIGSLISMLILFIVTTIFVQINTDSWQQHFFVLTIATVVLLNAVSAVLCGSIFGMVAKFPAKYITAVVGGQALGGIFAAIAQIVSLAIGASSVHSAFVYFMIANITIVFCLIAYLFLSKSIFFKHIVQNEPDGAYTYDETTNIVSHRTILKKIWLHGVSVLLVFMVTLSVYPGITVLIESKNRGNGNRWNDLYFVPVVAFLLVNCSDYSGRLLAGFFQRPERKSLLIIFNLLRIIFVPLLLFCNAQPRHSLPVLIKEDYHYIIILNLFALTNGYLTNLPVICTSRIVDEHEKESASALIAVFLGLGLTLGSAINLILVKIL
ncbi:equilibrative nucleoside transporter 3 [Agrilus planipennis]|uniref:Equilibrative nucleoside transporter 3 n=1 Tax=Agrilus planipennis TaxID=224129 RepID=A0A1W4XK12_AGRPL|nr:equilibrative nucleoside transporter 3 [Agrilus planipennis]